MKKILLLFLMIPTIYSMDYEYRAKEEPSSLGTAQNVKYEMEKRRLEAELKRKKESAKRKPKQTQKALPARSLTSAEQKRKSALEEKLAAAQESKNAHADMVKKFDDLIKDIKRELERFKR